MEISLQFTVLLAILILATVTAIEGLEASLTSSTATTTPSSPAPVPQELHEHSFFSHTALLPPILSHLGFHELAMAAPSLSDSPTSATASAWSGPSTIFAPSDTSIRTCFSCSIPDILREHIVPGLFTIDYLRRLAFGTKIETLNPGRCITVTSDLVNRNTSSAALPKVFIGGIEITQPDLFNNGMVVIHGLQGFISPLSPFSCDVERMTSLSFPFHPDHRPVNVQPVESVQPAIMRWMLRDAMLRLRNNGFSILALAMKVKYAELVTLNNMTIFAIEDLAIFSGSHSYISSIRFHVVPNHYLPFSDLEKLLVGTTLPTLERGQSLLVTTSRGGVASAPMRINYVRVKVSDVIRNVKIVIHTIYSPFPHISPVAAAYDSILGREEEPEGAGPVLGDQTMEGTQGTCAPLNEHGACAETPMPQVSQVEPMVEIEDHHGL